MTRFTPKYDRLIERQELGLGIFIFLFVWYVHFCDLRLIFFSLFIIYNLIYTGSYRRSLNWFELIFALEIKLINSAFIIAHCSSIIAHSTTVADRVM